MNNESDALPEIEVLPPVDPRSTSRIQKPDIVEIVRRAANRQSKKRGVVVATTTNTTKRKQRKESDIQAQAFTYYLGLGKDRTLPKVAEHFSLTTDAVNQWSHRLAWTDRIKKIENRNIGQVIEDTGLQVILSRLQQMFIHDPIDMQKMVIDPRASVSGLKDLVTAFVNLDKNSRERKEEDHGEGGSGKGKNQIMVNVIFET